MKRYKRSSANCVLDGPLLDALRVSFASEINFNQYPFCLAFNKNLTTIAFPTSVTFLVGENGAGKSTLLEAIAHKVGLGAEGGSKNINFTTSEYKHFEPAEMLAAQFILSWRMKPKDCYFFRAESFYNVANFIDSMAKEDGSIYDSYGGKSLHAKSHRESFFSFFKNRVGAGFFILDEPEAALSPQRQLALLAIIHEATKDNKSQFLIATHSPILLAYPTATIYSLDSDALAPVFYKDTPHYQITRLFLDNPEQYFRRLFSAD